MLTFWGNAHEGPHQGVREPAQPNHIWIDGELTIDNRKVDKGRMVGQKQLS